MVAESCAASRRAEPAARGAILPQDAAAAIARYRSCGKRRMTAEKRVKEESREKREEAEKGLTKREIGDRAKGRREKNKNPGLNVCLQAQT